MERKKEKTQLNLFAAEEAVCPVIKKGRAKLSAAQSEFNRLNKKITLLKEDIQELPEREQVIKQFFDTHVNSLFDEERELKLQLLDRLDSIYSGAMKLTKKEKTLFPVFILAETEGVEDFVLSAEQQTRLKEIREKYLDITSGLTQEEREKEAVKAALEFCSIMGIKPNARMKKARTEAELEAELEEMLRSQWEKEMKKEIEKGEKEPSGKKGKKTQKKLSQREIKQKLQEEQTLKSIREIYIELVKELHPDRETDENVRQQKEQRMKQLTEAYQAKDLASLLRMQIEWLEESAVRPDAQTDDVLKRYNKVLRSQLQRLEEEYRLMCAAPIPGVLGAYGGFRKYKLNALKFELDYMLNIHAGELYNIKEYVASFSNQAGVKANLKRFGNHLEEEEKYLLDDMDDALWDMLLKEK